jgi:hypothetical protein
VFDPPPPLAELPPEALAPPELDAAPEVPPGVDPAEATELGALVLAEVELVVLDVVAAGTALVAVGTVNAGLAALPATGELPPQAPRQMPAARAARAPRPARV